MTYAEKIRNRMAVYKACNHGRVSVFQATGPNGKLFRVPQAQCQCCGSSVTLSEFFEPAFTLLNETEGMHVLGK